MWKMLFLLVNIVLYFAYNMQGCNAKSSADIFSSLQLNITEFFPMESTASTGDTTAQGINNMTSMMSQGLPESRTYSQNETRTLPLKIPMDFTTKYNQISTTEYHGSMPVTSFTPTVHYTRMVSDIKVYLSTAQNLETSDMSLITSSRHENSARLHTAESPVLTTERPLSEMLTATAASSNLSFSYDRSTSTRNRTLAYVMPTSSVLGGTGKNSVHPIFHSSLSFTPTPDPTSCLECNKKRIDDKDFLYMILGVSIGATFLILVVMLVLTVCIRCHRKRTRNKAGLSSERNIDDFFMSKESIFSSSTLQLHSGVNNDGLELEMFHSPAHSERIPKHGSTFHPSFDQEPETITTHINLEFVDAVPSTSQQTIPESEYEASIKLLQDWDEHLEDENSEIYKELKQDVENSIKHVYRTKEGFQHVRLKSFRKGSIIVDFILIMLSAVCDPLDILENSVRSGTLGNLKVDRYYSITKNKNKEGEVAVLHKRQPYMKRILSGNATDKANNDTTVSSSIEVEVVTHQVSTKSSNVDGSAPNQSNYDLEGTHTQSPVDARNAASRVSLRGERDSGIGSMQELSRSESRINWSEGNVFYDIPESRGIPQSPNSNLVNAENYPTYDEDVPHVALYDFIGENDRELNMKQGDIFHLINKEVSGWVKVRNSQDKQGWVPVSFLVHVSQSQLADTQQTVETLEFFDNVLDELDNESFSGSSAASTPDGNTNQPDVSNDIYSFPEEGNGSLAPENTLEIQVKRCKSFYKFDAKDSSEISFKEGEIITVLKMSDVGWWKGKINEAEGWFPSSYVMPLNEESEVEMKKMPSDFQESNPGTRRHTYSFTGQIDDNSMLRPRKGSSIYEEPKSKISRTEHTYQSLQRGTRAREDYAHLYVQILKRESNENIPKSCDVPTLDVFSKGSSPDRPHRAPPIPPDASKNPFIPPINSLLKDNLASQRSDVQSTVISHGEPPKRPVPPAPTAKPPLASLSVLRSSKSSEIIFLDRDRSNNFAPPSRVKYENAPEKPRHSAQFILKESLRNPVPVISLKNENILSDSSTDVEENKRSHEGNTRNVKAVTPKVQEHSGAKCEPPAKPLPILHDMKRPKAPLKKSESNKLEMLQHEKLIKPSKPLPELGRKTPPTSGLKEKTLEINDLKSNRPEKRPIVPVKPAEKALKKSSNELQRSGNVVVCIEKSSSSSNSEKRVAEGSIDDKASMVTQNEGFLTPLEKRPPDRPDMSVNTVAIKLPTAFNESKRLLHVEQLPSVDTEEHSTWNMKDISSKVSEPKDGGNKDVNSKPKETYKSGETPLRESPTSSLKSPTKPKIPKKPIINEPARQIKKIAADVVTDSKKQADFRDPDSVKAVFDTKAPSKPVPAKRLKSVEGEKVDESSHVELADAVKAGIQNRSIPVPVPRKRIIESGKISEEKIVGNVNNVEPAKKKPERPPPPKTEESPKNFSPRKKMRDKSRLRKVVKPYNRRSEKELNLAIGDLLYELDVAPNQDASFGLLENGEQGWFPTDHVIHV